MATEWPPGLAPAPDHPFEAVLPRYSTPFVHRVCEHHELPGAVDPKPCLGFIATGEFYVRVVPTYAQLRARTRATGRDWCAVANGWVIQLDSPSELG
jgi:hypothetical protein